MPFQSKAQLTPSIKGIPNLIHPPKKAPKIRAPGKPINMLKPPGVR